MISEAGIECRARLRALCDSAVNPLLLERGRCAALGTAGGRGAEVVAAGPAKTLAQVATSPATGDQPSERRDSENDREEPVGRGEDNLPFVLMVFLLDQVGE